MRLKKINKFEKYVYRSTKSKKNRNFQISLRLWMYMCMHINIYSINMKTRKVSLQASVLQFCMCWHVWYANSLYLSLSSLSFALCPTLGTGPSFAFLTFFLVCLLNTVANCVPAWMISQLTGAHAFLSLHLLLLILFKQLIIPKFLGLLLLFLCLLLFWCLFFFLHSVFRFFAFFLDFFVCCSSKHRFCVGLKLDLTWDSLLSSFNLRYFIVCGVR